MFSAAAARMVVKPFTDQTRARVDSPLPLCRMALLMFKWDCRLTTSIIMTENSQNVLAKPLK